MGIRINLIFLTKNMPILYLKVAFQKKSTGVHSNAQFQIQRERSQNHMKDYSFELKIVDT